MKYAIPWLLALALLGCNETEECKALEKMKARYETALSRQKARETLTGSTRKRLERHKKRAEETKKKLGLDLPETKLKEELDARVAKIEGATIQRTTRKVADAGAPGVQSAAQETLWKIEFPAKNDKEAFERARMLYAMPPLFKVVTLLDKKDGTFLLELLRASVVEVPMNVAPTPLPDPPDPADVPEEFGFCGAGQLREEITEMRRTLLEGKEAAEELTVLLPKVATYEGLQHRAEMLGKVEMENRRVIEAFMEAVMKANIRFKGVGSERDVVVVEFFGGQQARSRLEKHMPPDLLKGMKELDSAKKNVTRLSMVNRVANQQIKHGGAMRPGVGLAPEKK